MNRVTRFFIFFALIFTVACKNKKDEIVIIPDYQKNHLQRNRLFGDVKTITTTLFTAGEEDGKIIETDSISTVIQQYSLDGFLMSVITLNALHDTVLVKKIHYKGDAMETMWEEFDSSGNKTAHCLYEYDMNGFLIREKIFRFDTLQLTLTYKNDGFGNPIEMTQDFKTYTVSNHFFYNDQGLISKIEEFDPSGKLFKYITIDYDNYGDEVNRRVFKSGNEELEYTYTKYNDKGQVASVMYQDKKHAVQDVLEYPEHDAKGNWLYEVRKKNKNVILVRKRTIEYY